MLIVVNSETGLGIGVENLFNFHAIDFFYGCISPRRMEVSGPGIQSQPDHLTHCARSGIEPKAQQQS